MIHKNCFYFIDKFEKLFINNLPKNINIIYRNYDKEYSIDEIVKIKKICRLKKRKFFLANNLKLAIKLNLDGAYIPSFNKSFFHKKRYSKNFIIAGSAHNVKEIKIKEKQNVNLIFLSPIFKIKKNNYFLDIAKFNILSKFSKKRIIALGGIKISNFKKLKMTSAFGFSGISHIKKIINN